MKQLLFFLLVFGLLHSCQSTHSFHKRKHLKGIFIRSGKLLGASAPAQNSKEVALNKPLEETRIEGITQEVTANPVETFAEEQAQESSVHTSDASSYSQQDLTEVESRKAQLKGQELRGETKQNPAIKHQKRGPTRLFFERVLWGILITFGLLLLIGITLIVLYFTAANPGTWMLIVGFICLLIPLLIFKTALTS